MTISFEYIAIDVPLKEFVTMLVNGSEKAFKRIANTLRPIILNMVIISYGGVSAMSVLSVRNNFSNFAEIYGASISQATRKRYAFLDWSIRIMIYYKEVCGKENYNEHY